jgi:hypothetical protein
MFGGSFGAEGVRGGGCGGLGRVEGDDGAVVEADAFTEGCCGGCLGWRFSRGGVVRLGCGQWFGVNKL